MKVVLAAVVKIGMDAIMEELIIVNAINAVIKHKPMQRKREITKENKHHAKTRHLIMIGSGEKSIK